MKDTYSTPHDKNHVYERNMSNHQSGKIKSQKLYANRLAKQYAEIRMDDMSRLIHLQQSIRAELHEQLPNPQKIQQQNPQKTGLRLRLENYLDDPMKCHPCPPPVPLQFAMLHHEIIKEARHRQDINNLTNEIAKIQARSTMKCQELETTIKKLEEQNRGLTEQSLRIRESLQSQLRQCQHQLKIQQERTKTLIDDTIDKNQKNIKEIAHMSQLIQQKNQQIERLTQQTMEKDRRMQQITTTYEEDLKHMRDINQNELQSKSNQFRLDQLKLSQQITKHNQQKMALSGRIQGLENTIRIQKQETQMLNDKIARMQEEVNQQKEKIGQMTNQHTRDIQKILEERNIMLEGLRKAYNDDKNVIKNYQQTIEQIRGSHKREVQLYLQDIESLKIKVGQKQSEVRDVVLKYDPLLQTVLELPTDSDRINRTDLELLRLMADRYKSESIAPL